MPFQFDVVGWEDYDGERRGGKPSDIDDTYGELVHAWDPVADEHHYFWAFVGGPFDEWEDWVLYIGALMDMHGMSLA